MKKDWEIKKLGDCCNIQNGYAFDSKFFTTNKKDMPLIRIRDIKRGFSETYYSAEYPKEYIVHKGDFLIGMDGEFNIGEWKSEDALLNQRVCRIVCDETKLLNRYIFYFIPKELKRIEEHTTYTTVKHLSSKQISEMLLPVPPLEEQKCIVKILDEKFAQLETIKTNAQTNLQNAKDLFQSQLTKAFSNTTWEKKTIGDICILKSGNSSSNNSKPGNLPYVKVGDMTINGNEKTITTSTLFVDYEENKKNIFPKGTVIFPKRGGAILTNKKRLTAVEICCDLNIMGVIPTDKILSEFLYYYFIGIDFAELCNGAAIPQINNIDINPLTISLPPLPEQKRIVKELDSLSEKVRQLQEIYTKQIANCDELKQAYLQKAFEGEL